MPVHEATPLVAESSEDRDDDKPTFLSLDFDRIINSYQTAATRARNASRRVGNQHDDDKQYPVHTKKQKVISDRGFHVSRWALTMLVGLCTGLTAVLILYCVEQLVDFRVNRLNRAIQFVYNSNHTGDLSYVIMRPNKWWTPAQSFGMTGVYVGYVLFNLTLVLISTLLCLLLAPAAVGSGIPEVMAYLNGVRVGVFDSMWLFVVKLVGTIFSVASGLVIGPEGPVVHLGAILGAVMTKTGDLEWAVRKYRRNHPSRARVLGCADGMQIDGEEEDDGSPQCRNDWISRILFYLSHFRNDLERRNLISVGAAAGFAAAFGAPVGGLLYSLEEASSFFAQGMLWRTLVGTVVATCCIAIYHGDFTKYSMLSLEIGVQEEDLMARFGEVPLYIVIGILGGVLGGTFNNIFHIVNHQRKHFYSTLSQIPSVYFLCKVLETSSVSIITSLVMLTLPLHASWACKEIEEGDSKEAFVHQYNCPPGYMNEIGSILFGSREESIKDILTDPTAFEPATLLSVALTFLPLMILTFGISVPTGMFMPIVLTGACLGGYAGIEFQRHFVDSVHPSDFALIGAAALLSGMQRNVVSLCVILMEGTGQTKVIIPIIMTMICARAVGNIFSEGIYEIGVEIKGYPYLHHGEKPRYDAFTAKDVMKTNIESVTLVESVLSVEALLLDSDSHAFPVVNEENRHYRGMIRRDQLIAALECKIYLESFNGGQGVEHTKVSSRVLKSQASFTDDELERPHISLKTAATTIAVVAAFKKQKRQLDVGREFEQARRAPQSVVDWNPDAPEKSSPWLRDNVMTSNETNEIMFGMDETLPDGVVEMTEKAIIKTVRGKVVVYVPPSEKDFHVDIGCLMNRSALSVSVDFPLSKTANTFCTLGLRHLPVLTTGGLVAGMISRDELTDERVNRATGFNLY
jgi:chloride channel 7